MTARTMLVAGLAALLVTAACGPSDGSEQTTELRLPPAPPVQALRATEPIVADDGLYRVIVTVPEARGDLSDAANLDGSRSTPTSRETWTLTPELMDQLPPDAVLSVDDGVIGYRGGDGDFVPLALGSPLVTGTAAEFLASIPGVESVQLITRTTYAVTATSLDSLAALDLAIAEDAPFALTADPYEPYQWALDNTGDNLSEPASIPTHDQSSDADVDGLEARVGATGRGIVVAVVDSGVDFSHPDLLGADWINPGEDCGGSTGNGIDDDGNGFVDDCAGWDFGADDHITFDGNNDSHGTHVAGIIAARSENGYGVSGIAPDALIMDLMVSNPAGMISSSAIARAIRYAADNGAQVVNLSLGSLPGASLESVAQIADAVDYAGSKGVLLVVAAGNNGLSLDDSPVYPASFDTAQMLVVAASGPSDRRSSFSNVGSAVDLFAPGELILSTVPGNQFAFQSGTSQAAPMVAATAALVLEAEGGVGTATVIDRLIASADSLDQLAGLTSGPLRLNAARAVGIEADESGDGGSITIRGLTADDEGRVSATVSMAVVSGQFNQPFHWEASLLAVVDGAPFAISGHPVTVGNAETLDSATDGRGAVVLANEDARSAAWSTQLPPGTYAILIEAIPRTDPTVRLGDAFVAMFVVDGPAGTSDEGSPADGGTEQPADPASGTDSTEAPTSDTGDDSGSTPNTSVPAGPTDDANESGRTPASAGTPSTTQPTNESAVPTTEDGSARGRPDSDADSEPVRADGSTTPGDSIVEKTAGVSSSGAPSGGEAAAPVEGDAAIGGSETIELGPDNASAGGWSITSVTPRTGLVDNENLVEVTGTFPGQATVWFGDSAGEMVFASEQLILVRTGRHAKAETVDVSLRSRTDGEVLNLPDAYAFLAVGDDRPVVETDDEGTSNGVDINPIDDPGFGADRGAGDLVEDTPPPDAGPDSGRTDAGDNTARSRNRQARAEIEGAPQELPNGLIGVPLSGMNTIGAVPKCNEDPCRTRRI